MWTVVGMNIFTNISQSGCGETAVAAAKRSSFPTRGGGRNCLVGQGEVERGAPFQLALGPDVAAMAVDDALDRREADAW